MVFTPKKTTIRATKWGRDSEKLPLWQHLPLVVEKNMKQHITKEQWDELDIKQKDILGMMQTTNPDNYVDAPIKQWTIGQMIEFLGDDFKEIRYVSGSWKVFFYIKGELIELLGKNLCDSLWEACKEKLTNPSL